MFVARNCSQDISRNGRILVSPDMFDYTLSALHRVLDAYDALARVRTLQQRREKRGLATAGTSHDEEGQPCHHRSQ